MPEFPVFLHLCPVFIAINAVFMVLTEIKKGQTGTGLLIENDGYVSLDMPENKILKENLEKIKKEQELDEILVLFI